MAVAMTVRRVFRWFLDLVAELIGLFIVTKKGRHELSPIKNQLLLESAIELVVKIRTGQVKCVDLMTAYINRINEVDPQVNAICQNRFQLALSEAADLDRAISEALVAGDQQLLSKPLLGIPFTGKDSVAITGMYYTAGVKARRGVLADSDADVTANLKSAGAIPIALTNVPELAIWWDSENMLFGRTNNPYDLSRIVGGSSGGQAAVIAYAGSLLGNGSDLGGSIRMPAFFCGIFGHKTTPGVVPTTGHYPDISVERQRYLSMGPMCRYAVDLKPMLTAMAGSQISKLPKLLDQLDFKKVKIYYMNDDGGQPFNTPVKSDIKQCMAKFTDYMSSQYGAEVTAVRLTKFVDSFNIFVQSLKMTPSVTLAAAMAQLDGEVNLWLELVKKLFGQSDFTLPMIIVALTESLSPNASSEISKRFYEIGQELQRELYELLGDDGVLIYPCHPEVAPKHKTTILKMHNTSYTAIFNILRVPITQCPMGLNSDGLPLGFQIVASPFNDHLTIALAEEVERQFGGWVSPTQVSCQMK